jgi:hypothetical protein
MIIMGGKAPRKIYTKKLDSLKVPERTETNTVCQIRVMSTYEVDRAQLQVQPGQFKRTILWVDGLHKKTVLCWFNTDDKRVLLDWKGEWYYVSENTVHVNCIIIDSLS